MRWSLPLAYGVVAITLLVVLVLDLVIPVYYLAVLYAIPLLIAVLVLPSRHVGIVVIITLAAGLIGGVEATTPIEIRAIRFVGLAFVGLFSFQLSRELSRERERVAEQSRRVTDILESISDAFYALDAHWRFTYINKEAERLLRKSRSQLIGTSVWDEFPEAVNTEVYNEYHKVMAQGVAAAFEIYYEPLQTWFSVHAYPSAEGITVYFEDITERKHAEGEQERLLEEVERRATELEALQQVADPSLARLALEPLLKSLLERMVAIMGANAGAILLLDPDKGELVLRAAVGIPEDQALGLRVKVGKDFSGRVASRKTTFWVRDAQADPSVTSPYIKDNNIRAIIGVPMNIGEEIIGVVHVDFLVVRDFGRHEERLLKVVAERAGLAIYQARLLEGTIEERNRLQSVLDTAPVGIAFYLVPDGRLQFSNKAFEIILGRPLVPGMSVTEQASYYDLRKPSGEPFSLEERPVIRSLFGETVIGVEVLVLQPSGHRVYVQVNSAPLRHADGQIVGAIAVYQDITRIKEQELLRNEFLSAAAHELKTPVTTIKGYAQLMRQWTPQERLAREAQAIEVINTQTDRISRRVQEMLEAVRFRKTPPKLQTVHFDLGDLVFGVVQRMQTTTKVIRFILKRDGSVPVEADRERIEEVMVSLLDNAIKYSPKGGDVEVRVWAQKGKALVSVKDHGVGISKERQSHIFEPFFEAVPPGAPGYSGVVALSLYLSKLVIERHKGHIWFESEEGKGSTFYFSLPLAEGSGNSKGKHDGADGE